MKKLYIVLAVLVVGLGTLLFTRSGGDSGIMNLDAKSWELVSIGYSDGKEVTPKQEGDFVLTLKDDNTFSLETDCNQMGGEYVLEGNLISFKNIFSTKMYCEGSIESEVSLALQNAQGFFYDTNGGLVIDLQMDSGSMYFK